MTFKKLIKMPIILILILLTLSLFCGASFVNVETANVNSLLSTINAPNYQEYVGNDGSNRTVYWAQGITPPQMADDKTLAQNYGKPGNNYFERFEETIGSETYIRYRAPVKDGAGYYDLNKNPQRTNIYPQQVAHHCYLAAALNILYWWLDQNSSYIDIYTNRLSSGDYYYQHEGLIPLYPYDKEMWDLYRKSPTLSEINLNGDKVFSHELSDSEIYKHQMQAYQTRDEGYYSNGVWDYFINGYLPEQPDGLNENKPSSFIPSRFGGFFYPLFGIQPISHITNSGNFEVFQEGLKKAFSRGQAVVINYQSIGLGTAHAITCWGAEFDDKGVLQRVFITDSDDFDKENVDEKTKTMYGLVSMEVIKSKTNGLAILTTKNKEVSSGPELISFSYLDLMTDEFKANTEDLEKDPVLPNILIQPKSASYSPQNVNIDTLEIEVEKKDSGYFTYQWYKSNDIKTPGEKIVGATNKWYKPPKPNTDPSYYYCVVKNNKNGKVSLGIESLRAEISINTELTDAAQPANLKYINGGNKMVAQYTKLPGVIVQATSPDGGELSYQWYHKLGTNFTPEGGEKLEGETSNIFYPPTYLYEVVNGLAETHTYYCVVTNTNNNVNGNKIATASPAGRGLQIIVSDKAVLQNAYEPYIMTEPKDQTYKENDIIKPLSMFAKTVDGGTISYNWYLNGELVSGENKNTYLPKITAPGTYYVQGEAINTNNSAVKNNTSSARTSLIKIVVEGNKPELSKNNNLKSLSVVNNTINPIFNPSILSYTLTVQYSVEKITIVGELEDNKASVDGLKEYTLKVGLNDINIIVIAENGDKKTYNIKVTREEEPYIESNDNNLSSLSVLKYQIKPVFNSSITEYKLTVPYEVTNIQVSGTLSDSKASVEGLKEYTLKVGLNDINIIVTAENGDQKTYNIKVTREEEIVIITGNFLKEITVNGIQIDVKDNVKNYNIILDSTVSEVNIEAILKDGIQANILVEGNTNLEFGDNAFIIKITSNDGYGENINLNINRKINTVIDDNNGPNKAVVVGVSISVSLLAVAIIVAVVIVVLRKKGRI